MPDGRWFRLGFCRRLPPRICRLKNTLWTFPYRNTTVSATDDRYRRPYSRHNTIRGVCAWYAARRVINHRGRGGGGEEKKRRITRRHVYYVRVYTTPATPSVREKLLQYNITIVLHERILRRIIVLLRYYALPSSCTVADIVLFVTAVTSPASFFCFF